MGNPYFSFFSEGSNEFSTFADLVDEMIEMMGIPIFYMPKKNVSIDKIFGEDPLVKYPTKIPITMYIENTDAFEGSGDILAKFGLVRTDEMTFWVNRYRFVNEVGLDEPMMGDLIYLPWTKDQCYMEITMVEPEKTFYHLGNWCTWKIGCRIMELSHENITPETPDLTETYTSHDHLDDSTDIKTEFEAIRDFTPENPFGE